MHSLCSLSDEGLHTSCESRELFDHILPSWLAPLVNGGLRASSDINTDICHTYLQVLTSGLPVGHNKQDWVKF